MYQKVTLTLPKEVWTKVEDTFPKGERSGFVASAITQEIQNLAFQEKMKELKTFEEALNNLRKKYGKKKVTDEQIFKYIEKGRK